MATCQATTSAGHPCSCKARVGFVTCGRHKNVGVIIDLTVCGKLKTNGDRCQKHCAEGDTLCRLHRTIVNRREQQRRADGLFGDVLDLLWSLDPPQTFAPLQEIVMNGFDSGWIDEAHYDELAFRVLTEWQWFQRERVVATKHASTELQRLALDRQNVHTGVVNKQTTDVQSYLLKIPVPTDQDTLSEIETAWSNKSQTKKVLKDMKKWYKASECVEADDWLYKKMLDGLWVQIKTHTHKTELIERLWEEAYESVDMCCQGHLCRIANVLVGFSEEVKAEVPVGEILQQRIAAIAAKEIGVENKVCEAWVVFEELNVPMEERDAWIEAF